MTLLLRITLLFGMFHDAIAFHPATTERHTLLGAALRAGSCLGHRNRWRRLDFFGRPEQVSCCPGNIFAVQGDRPWRCTHAQCAHAMGIDVDHMDYLGLTQAIPPAYGHLVFAQMCMDICAREYGVPRWTFDEMQADKARARREMGAWVGGAGLASGDAALVFGVGRGEIPDEAVDEGTAPPGSSAATL